METGEYFLNVPGLQCSNSHNSLCVAFHCRGILGFQSFNGCFEFEIRRRKKSSEKELPNVRQTTAQCVDGTLQKNTEPDGSHSTSFGSAILQCHLNTLSERIQCTSFFSPLPLLPTLQRRVLCKFPIIFFAQVYVFQFNFMHAPDLAMLAQQAKSAEKRRERAKAFAMLGLAFAVATVSLNHLLRSGI